LTVLLKLPAPVSIAHACLGQTVFCLVLTLAQATSPWYVAAAASHEPPGPWRAGAAAVAAVFLQLLWGATVRHTGLAVPLHSSWAAAVVLAVGYSAYVGLTSRQARPELGGPSTLLIALLPLQLALGLVSLAIKRSATFDIGFYPASALLTTHLAVGALILGTTLIWTLRARRL
jgi:heme A synthase